MAFVALQEGDSKGFRLTLRLVKECSTNNDQQDEQHYDQYEVASA